MFKIKKITQKIMAGFLSLAMVLTGAMSLSTMKKHTASADMQTFVALMLAEMESTLGNNQACLIVDNELIPGVGLGTRLNNITVASGSFLDELTTQLGIACTPTAFRNIGFYLFAQRSTSNAQYTNLLTGLGGNFTDLETNGIASIAGNYADFSSDTSFFGAMRWTTNIEIIDYFKVFKNELGNNGFTVYTYEKQVNIEAGEEPISMPTGANGLWVRYYADGDEAFSDLAV